MMMMMPAAADDVARIQMSRTAYRHNTMCNSHAKLHGQCRYERLEVTLNHVRLWTMGDASGGESDEGLRPRSKGGCWTADGEKRMAVAGAGLTRVTKIEKALGSPWAFGMAGQRVG